MNAYFKALVNKLVEQDFDEQKNIEAIKAGIKGMILNDEKNE